MILVFLPTMKKLILMICGFVLVALGTLGIFLPLLPTTPFLLLAAYCFLKSSEKAYNWLLNNKLYGTYVRDYIEKKGVPVKIKIVSLILLWSGILYSVIFVTEHRLLRASLMIILIGVTLHILTIKNKKN